MGHLATPNKTKNRRQSKAAGSMGKHGASTVRQANPSQWDTKQEVFVTVIHSVGKYDEA